MARPAMQSLLVVAALITAVPSVQALHPGTANTDLMEDDLTGSGCEVPNKVLWLQIAADLRSLAEVSQDPERERELLKAADQYEEKARQIEASGEGCER